MAAETLQNPRNIGEVWDNETRPKGVGSTLRPLTRSSDLTREGLAMKATRTLDETTFWNHVDRDPSGCWLWTASTSGGGYGQFNVAGLATRQAHRLAYEHHAGPIPEGLVLDHLCRVRNCVNPDHLEVVTQAENNRRAAAVRLKVTHCPEGHAFDEANTRTDSKGRRHCRACHRREASRYRALVKAALPPGTVERTKRVEVDCGACGRTLSRKSLRAHERRCLARDDERAAKGEQR